MKVAFCFPGQGSVEPGMGREIAEAVPEARAVYERASAASNLDLERLCFHSDASELLDTAVQQPALVATSLAMLAAIRARGIEPDCVIGHSVGEFAAIAACGSMTDEEAIALVRERGIAMAEAAARHPGSMAAILGLADDTLMAACASVAAGICVPANFNSDGQIVISGDRAGVEEGMARAKEAGAKRAVPLNVSGGLLSNGHPIAATGIANMYELVQHLRGNAGERQVQGARIGMAHVVGLGTSAAVHILEKA